MADDNNLLGSIREKLVRTKEKWARDGRLMTGSAAPRADRLPPGQRLVRDWPVLDLGVQPQVAPESWSLTIDGLVSNPVQWSHNAFFDQPQVEMVSDIHCVTSWSRYENRWQGVSAAHILDVVQPLPEARHIVFHGYDGYTTNVGLDVFAAPDVLLAHSWEGEPLTKEHGAPVRVVIPQFYFWKSAKWIKRLEFVVEDKPGFWEVRGYHNEGDPWEEDRYS
jgi:DMSO/TMAO reductase YedYZ molybdopterin-dependent catalytic subunit